MYLFYYSLRFLSIVVYLQNTGRKLRFICVVNSVTEKKTKIPLKLERCVKTLLESGTGWIPMTGVVSRCISGTTHASGTAFSRRDNGYWRNETFPSIKQPTICVTGIVCLLQPLSSVKAVADIAYMLLRTAPVLVCVELQSVKMIISSCITPKSVE